MIVVSVPASAVRLPFHCSPVDLNKLDPRLNQSSGKQNTLSPTCTTVSIPRGVRFQRDIKRLAGLSTSQQFQCLLSLTLETRNGGRVPQPIKMTVQLLQQ